MACEGLNIYHSAGDSGVDGIQAAESPRFEPLVKPLDIGCRPIYKTATLELIRNHFSESPTVAVVGMNGILADPYVSEIDYQTLTVNPEAKKALETLASEVPVVVWTTNPKRQTVKFLETHNMAEFVSLIIAKENYAFKELHDDIGQLFMSSFGGTIDNYPHLNPKSREFVVHPNMERIHQGSYKLPRLIWDFSKKIIHFEDQTEWQRLIPRLNREAFPGDTNYNFVEVGRFNSLGEPIDKPIFSQEVVLKALAAAK